MTNMLQKIFGQIETKEQFDALRITIASPEEILSWSHGEVKKPETSTDFWSDKGLRMRMRKI